MNRMWAAIFNCKTLADYEQAAEFAAYLAYKLGGEVVRNQPDGFYGRGLADLLN